MGVNKHNYIAMGKAAGKKGKTFTLYPLPFTLYPLPFTLTKRYIVRFNCANLLKLHDYCSLPKENVKLFPMKDEEEILHKLK
jgi:hypothetical protein